MRGRKIRLREEEERQEKRGRKEEDRWVEEKLEYHRKASKDDEIEVGGHMWDNGG